MEKEHRQSTFLKNKLFRVLASDKLQGEKNESKINVELRSDFSTSRVRVNPTEKLRFEQRFKEAVEVSHGDICRRSTVSKRKSTKAPEVENARVGGKGKSS